MSHDGKVKQIFEEEIQTENISIRNINFWKYSTNVQIWFRQTFILSKYGPLDKQYRIKIKSFPSMEGVQNEK